MCCIYLQEVLLFLGLPWHSLCLSRLQLHQVQVVLLCIKPKLINDAKEQVPCSKGVTKDGNFSGQVHTSKKSSNTCEKVEDVQGPFVCSRRDLDIHDVMNL